MSTFFEVNPTGSLLEFIEKHQATLNRLTDFDERFQRMEATLEDLRDFLLNQHTVKECYTVEEIAEILGKSRFTVREWCRHGRLRAVKGQAGRGAEKEWRISHEELLRYQNEGLIPLHH